MSEKKQQQEIFEALDVILSDITDNGVYKVFYINDASENEFYKGMMEEAERIKTKNEKE